MIELTKIYVNATTKNGNKTFHKNNAQIIGRMNMHLCTIALNYSGNKHFVQSLFFCFMHINVFFK